MSMEYRAISLKGTWAIYDPVSRTSTMRSSKAEAEKLCKELNDKRMPAPEKTDRDWLDGE